jgi:hypothetical protein
MSDDNTLQQIKDLFVEYEKRKETLIQKKKEVDAALNARSEVVNKIAALIAPKKKLTYKGKDLTVVQRGDTVFFRGLSDDSNEIKID